MENYEEEKIINIIPEFGGCGSSEKKIKKKDSNQISSDCACTTKDCSKNKELKSLDSLTISQ